MVPGCRTLIAELTAYEEGAGSGLRRAGVKLHLAVCGDCSLSEENQRVLLHRGRARLRSALELALAEPVPAPVPA